MTSCCTIPKVLMSESKMNGKSLLRGAEFTVLAEMWYCTLVSPVGLPVCLGYSAPARQQKSSL